MQGKNFYSRAAYFTIQVSSGRNQIVEGTNAVQRVGEKLACFNALPDGFGHYYTEDPEEIAFLEDRAVKYGDVFDAAKYNKLAVPPAKRAELLEREIAQKNELIAKLMAEGKIKTSKG